MLDKTRASVAGVRIDRAPLTVRRIDAIAIALPLKNPMKMAGITIAKAENLLVRIEAVGLCHTDIVAQAGEMIPLPGVLGHEGAGVVEAVGDQVTKVAPGDRVVLTFRSCGHCRNCRAGKRHLCRNTIGVGVNRPGCFAEFLVIPAVNAFKSQLNSASAPPACLRPSSSSARSDAVSTSSSRSACCTIWPIRRQAGVCCTRCCGRTD